MIGRTNAGGGRVGTKIPAFTFTGEFFAEQEDKVNWKIKFLTSGTLNISKLNGANSGVDIFVCGGGGGGGRRTAAAGGGGGGGGYAVTQKGLTLQSGIDYEIEIGAGGPGAPNGETGTNGGASSFGNFIANGGFAGGAAGGGNGGSGGGGDDYGNGGTNGSDGTNNYRGYGSGNNMHEFEDDTLPIYGGGGGSFTGGRPTERGLPGDETAGGGAVDNGSNGFNGKTNRGGGGGGAYNGHGGSGGSGIVIMRNHRGI